jgi:hypothetical protein
VSRGIGGIATCWPLASAGGALNNPSPTTLPFHIRAQDLVAHQVGTPPTTYSPAGGDACYVQTADTAIPLNVWFLPIDTSGNAVGTAYKYSITTDLMGPPPPSVQPLSIGDTLLVVNWTASTDPDIAGYAVFMDPTPGNEAQGPVSDGGGGDTGGTVETICPDTGAPPADGSTDGDDGGDASPADAGDAGCYQVIVNNGGGGSGQGTCSSTLLSGTGSLVSDAGGVTTDDSGVQTTTYGGGISNIPLSYKVAEIDDKAANTATVAGLSNGYTYNVVVSALDGSGNIGPPSSEVCDSPQPVDDFWKRYRDAGGQAGGGFCALEAAGSRAGSAVFAVGLAAAGAAWARRRRKR